MRTASAGEGEDGQGYDALYDHHLDRALGLARLLCASPERDGEGRAAAAWGNALPAGTFAAG